MHRTGIGRPRLAALVGEDDGNAQVDGHLRRDRARERADVAQQPVPPARVAIGEVGPGGRDHGQVDPVAIVVPDLAVDHVGADREADAAPRASRRPAAIAPGLEPEPLPEHQVALAVDLDVAVGVTERQRIVEMPPVALDEPGGDRHPPLPAALAKVRERGPFGGLAVRTEVRAEAVAGVEELGQDGQLGAGVASRSQQVLVGPLQIAPGTSSDVGSASGSRQRRSSRPFTSAFLEDGEPRNPPEPP